MSIEFIKGFLEVAVEVVAVTNAIFVGDPGVGPPRIPFINVLRATKNHAEALHDHRQGQVEDNFYLALLLGLRHQRGDELGELAFVLG